MSNLTAPNQANMVIFLSKSEWLEKLGFTWLMDGLYIFLVAPFDLLGMLLNLISFIVLCRPVFNKIPLFSYLKVYFINSLLVNLIEFLVLFAHGYCILDFPNSPIISFFFVYLYVPFLNSSIMFGSFLDICISIERISHFTNKLNFMRKYSTLKISLIMFGLSASIGSLYFFLFQSFILEVKLNATTTFKIYYWKNSEFAQSLTGSLLTFSTYFLRDVLVLILETCLNISTVNMLKRHFRNKKSMQTEIKHDAFTKTEKNQTIMVILMCSLSTLQHVFLMLMAIYFTFSHDKTALLIGIFSNLIVSVKHFSNLFLIYLFNKKFRIEFKKLFKIQ